MSFSSTNVDTDHTVPVAGIRSSSCPVRPSSTTTIFAVPPYAQIRRSCARSTVYTKSFDWCSHSFTASGRGASTSTPAAAAAAAVRGAEVSYIATHLSRPPMARRFPDVSTATAYTRSVRVTTHTSVSSGTATSDGGGGAVAGAGALAVRRAGISKSDGPGEPGTRLGAPAVPTRLPLIVAREARDRLACSTACSSSSPSVRRKLSTWAAAAAAAAAAASAVMTSAGAVMRR